MKLFAKPLLSWNEPALFSARTRDRRGWVLRGLLALLIFGTMLAAMLYERQAGKPARMSTAGAVVFSAFIGVFLAAMLDAPELNRNVTINDDAISAFGNAGTAFSHISIPLRAVREVRLYRPEELGWSFGMMEVEGGRRLSRFGVPRKVAVERIAQVLHEQGLPVRLADWTPGVSEPAASGVGSPAAVPLTTKPTAEARIEPLPEAERGRNLGGPHLGIALAMSLGPLLVGLFGGLGLLGFTVYQMVWAGAAGSLELTGMALGGMALIALGFWYGLRYSSLVPSLYLRVVARRAIATRLDACVDPNDPEAVYVDVIPRAHWGKVMVREMSDTGFLKCDPYGREVLFEGDLERWRIPAGSLLSVEVESWRPPGQVEGQEGEVYHAAVVRAKRGDDVWEAPLVAVHVDPRPRTNASREAGAQALRERIRAIVARPG